MKITPIMTPGPEAFPETVVARDQAIADEHPHAECLIAGGLATQLARGFEVGSAPGSDEDASVIPAEINPE